MCLAKVDVAAMCEMEKMCPDLFLQSLACAGSLVGFKT